MDKSKTMKEFDDGLDEEVGTAPKRKTPEEMQQNPMDLIEERYQEQKKQQALDDTWTVTENGEPRHGQDNTINNPNGIEPGSEASEGRGTRAWGIDDNGSEKGPKKSPLS
jgi:hypothetical protein